ncbi:MAG: hypothetical protein J0J01_07745 [Reyranella sp.]|uniref:hypothetical protein n=1 Tax=Reyranella sp. TaxID=1929291 RepID=UPI001ACA5656|nr:hypothetical protein [Reyranella sp.]MBN9086784.1 hypothetical protein [Reyranella sp.]
MRPVVIALGLLLAGCIATPKPFEHDSGNDEPFRPKRDKIEVAIAPPANMPDKMAERVATALAIELQSYDIVAAVQPTAAPLKVAGAMSTRDAEFGTGIEIEIEWYVLGKGRGLEGPAISKTVVQSRDFLEANDRLVSRIAQQAAPRIATLMGKPPVYEARAPGQIAAGVNAPTPGSPEPSPAQAAAAAGSTAPPPAAGMQTPPTNQRAIKVMVAPIEGAPSDGNRQLFGGMRRALGSSKIVVMDSPGADTFVVTGRVKLTAIDDRSGQLELTWVLKDPSGKEIGKVDQSNPVPLAATRGSWAGFGDIVAQAAVEGILELLEKSLGKPR